MKDLFEICGECRHLSDSEVVYQLTNNREPVKELMKCYCVAIMFQ